MSEVCVFPLCTRKSEHEGFCVFHKIYASVPEAKKKKTPIAKRSEKMTGEMKEYKKEAAAYLKAHPFCEIREKGCTRVAVAIHHTRRRGKNLRNQKDWKASCANCNTYVESNDFEARQKGYLKSKYSKD